MTNVMVAQILPYRHKRQVSKPDTSAKDAVYEPTLVIDERRLRVETGGQPPGGAGKTTQAARRVLTRSLTGFYWSGAAILLTGLIFVVREPELWQRSASVSVLLGLALVGMVVGYGWFRHRAARAHLEPPPEERIFLGLVTVSSLALVALVPKPFAFAFPISASGTFAQLPRRVGAALLFASMGLQLVALHFLWPPSGQKYIVWLFAVQVQFLALLFSSNLFREWRSIDRLIRLNRDLASTRRLLRATVAASEKSRLADELHDVTGHKLVAAKLQLGMLSETVTSEDEQSRVAAVQSLVQELIHDMRGIVAARVGPNVADFRAALETLITSLPEGLCTLHYAGDVQPTLQQAETLLRVAQEGLTNALKHADARRIDIRCTHSGDRIVLEISDNGRGFSLDHIRSRGIGLKSMRTRLDDMGGHFRLESGKGEGTTIRAELPAHGRTP